MFEMKQSKKNNLKILLKEKEKMVINVNDKYIIKFANNRILLSEYFFLKTYKENDLIEDIIKYDNENEYSVYKYVRGKEKYNSNDIEDIVEQIILISKQYKSFNLKGYGDILKLDKTWYEFLQREFKQKKKDMYIDINKSNKVEESLKQIKKYKFDKKIIHGDLGIYNIIHKKGKIIKIIDPRTIVGDPLYDILFFVFSSKKIVNSIKLNNIIKKINEPIEKIKAMMYIILYNRMSVENKHHMNIEVYEKIWKLLDLI